MAARWRHTIDTLLSEAGPARRATRGRPRLYVALPPGWLRRPLRSSAVAWMMAPGDASSRAPEPERDDADLLRRVRAGDAHARDQFVGRFWPDVEAEAFRYARLGGARDELLSEGALALWEAAVSHDASRHTTDVPTYVRNAIHRRVRRAYQRAMGFGRTPDAPLDWAARMSAVERRYGDAEHRLDLARALDRLPSAEREAMRRYVSLARQGFGPDEAARHLARERGGTPAAWKKRLQRGRRHLRRWLDSRPG